MKKLTMIVLFIAMYVVAYLYRQEIMYYTIMYSKEGWMILSVLVMLFIVDVILFIDLMRCNKRLKQIDILKLELKECKESEKELAKKAHLTNESLKKETELAVTQAKELDRYNNMIVVGDLVTSTRYHKPTKLYAIKKEDKIYYQLSKGSKWYTREEIRKL